MANGTDRLAVTDAQIDGYFSARGVTPVWSLDGQATATSHGQTFVTQGFAAQTAYALNDWPTQLCWFLYAEGTFSWLDGGSLDVGIVRDSLLNSTNDFGTFCEVFETVAFRGVESLQVISNVRPSGESAASASTSSY